MSRPSKKCVGLVIFSGNILIIIPIRIDHLCVCVWGVWGCVGVCV